MLQHLFVIVFFIDCKPFLLSVATWKKFLTVRELEEELEKVCDDLDAERADKVEIICLPPPTVDEISDEESIDDNEQLFLDTNELPTELAGELEMVCDNINENQYTPPAEPRQEDAVVSSQAGKRKRNDGKRKKEVPVPPKWKKQQPEFSNNPVDISTKKVEDLYAKLGSKSPLELFELFIDDEILDLILTNTNKYA